MTEPRVGTDTHTLWKRILTSDPQTLTKLKLRAAAIEPRVNLKSISVHLRSLVRRGFVERTQTDRYPSYHRIKAPRHTALTDIALAAIKTKVGESVNATEIQTALKTKSTAVYGVLSKLASSGYLTAIAHGKLARYKVNQSILTLETLTQMKPAVSGKSEQPAIIEPQILLEPVAPPSFMEMSLSELINNAMRLRDENIKMKNTLESIGRLLVQVGVVED